MKRITLFGLLLALLLLLAIVTSVPSQATSAPPEKPGSPPIGISQHTKPLSGGVPAIAPRAEKVSAHILPTFTESDVRLYIKMHPFGKTIDKKDPQYTVQFLSAKDAKKKYHGPIATNPIQVAPIVCYVEFKGPFKNNIPFRDPGATNLPASPIGVEIFDGQTGDLLTWGT